VVSSSYLRQYPDLVKPFCFQSDLWQQANFKSFNLTTNYRQTDGPFLKALGEIRIGKVSDEVNDMMLSRLNIKLDIPFEPVKLFSLKDSVAKENIECLKKLKGDKILSTAEFEGKQYDIDILKKECQAEENLYYCRDAQVMMITNDPQGLWVNGTMGKIEKADPNSTKIKLSNGKIVEIIPHTWERVNHKLDLQGNLKTEVVGKMIQMPFVLGYSSSIHKSQSLTLDYAEMDLSNCFACGMAYTSLSRIRSINNLKLTGWNRKSVKADLAVKQFYGLI